MAEVRIGCAGWSYRDWVGPVYSPRLPPSRWLQTYASWFPIVEIDSTFYALPAEATVQGWIERVRDRPGFRFSAKVPQAATHDSLAKGRLDEALKWAAEFIDRVVRPLERARLLDAVLVQLPPTYAVYEGDEARDALTRLVKFLEGLEPRNRRVAVEFRHASWYEHVGERLLPEVVEALSALPVSATRVDGLGSRLHQSRTAPWSYVRLHGRRTHIPPSERGLSHAPYNYLYSLPEIGGIAQSLHSSILHDDRTLVIFNNHYRGQAARNAMDLMETLGQPRPRPAPVSERLATLDEFGGP